MTHEENRLHQHHNEHTQDWLRWGPYLSERQWGTVREDYSAHGDAWQYFPFDHARSRVYRWGEDGIAGLCDKYCNLCFSVAMWNHRDPFLKERLYGLSGPQGNHGEDVKELYYYLDATPTNSYLKQLYKYPQRSFPYYELLSENKQRDRQAKEYELLDTNILADNKYFDVVTEYAKADADDICIRITVHNRSEETAVLDLLPTLWFRNSWKFELIEERPTIELLDTGNDEYGCVKTTHEHTGGSMYLYFETPKRTLFCENETNTQRIWGKKNKYDRPKDAINDAVIGDDYVKFDGIEEGTKFSPQYHLKIKGGGSKQLRLRLCYEKTENPLGRGHAATFTRRKKEADRFYETLQGEEDNDDLHNIQRQAFAGLLWTKQFYYYDVNEWLDGDENQITPPKQRKEGRNSNWRTLFNKDILSMPDKWEYPWYAAWDSAFHMVPLSLLDPTWAKDQLILFLREWYQHPNGQLPAYEWNFGDVNPPVHAWACMRVYRLEQERTGKQDIVFLKRVFQKLTLNFTWWVNRKDHNENNIFQGGFLGLDNIGVFDRSSDIPGGGVLQQVDGTSWMAMYALNMLDMAMEIALHDESYEDVATKFFEHFVHISAAINQFEEDFPGSWDDDEGFYYDMVEMPDGESIPLKVRSLVGLTSFFANMVLDWERLEQLPHFRKRLEWFRNYRQERGQYLVIEKYEEGKDILLSLIPRKRLERMMHALLDSEEFYAPGGIRSLSKIHKDGYSVTIDGREFGLSYEPAESETAIFGGNSNWRGPIWFPMNYLIIQSMEVYCRYYGDEIQVPCPEGSRNKVNFEEIAERLRQRLIGIFRKDKDGHRAVHGTDELYATDPHFKDLLLFYEYFHGDTSRGMGAAHQTGWTGLVAELIRRRSQKTGVSFQKLYEDVEEE